MEVKMIHCPSHDVLLRRESVEFSSMRGATYRKKNETSKPEKTHDAEIATKLNSR